MKKIIYSLLVSVFLGSNLCAQEEVLSKTTYEQEILTHLEKERFLREEKEALACGRESLFFCDIHAGALMFFVPSIGVGARFQQQQLGFDLSLDYHTVILANALSAKGSFLYFFPNKDFDKQVYVGLGGGGGVLFGNDTFFSTAGTGFGLFTLGKKLGRKTYSQFELTVLRSGSQTVYLPTFKIGMGF